MSEARKKTLASAWAEYEARGINPLAGDVQRKLMRQAFYVGAQSLWSMLVDNPSHERNADQIVADDLELMGSIEAEFDGFKREIQAMVQESRGARAGS